tara:strand:- start:1432 stop:1989 length:558 start_codon:yes stop_codon:yes gene_type:complete
MRKIFFILIFFIFFSNNSFGSVKEKIIANFNKIENLNFNFKQTINGKDETGNCTINYPGKIYCKYKLNSQKIMVSNGNSLVIKNSKNKQYYRYPLENTPLVLLLDKEFLINKIKNLKGENINNKYFVFSIIDSRNIINVYFDNKNYNLVGWQTEDIYQNLVITFISDLKINSKIDNKIFNLPKMF